MNVNEGIAAALLGAVQDARVNVLCIRKPEVGDSRIAITAVRDAVPTLRIEYWDRAESDRRTDRRIRSMTDEIMDATDGRSVRGMLSTIYELSRQKGQLPKHVYRNGFSTIFVPLVKRSYTLLSILLA